MIHSKHWNTHRISNNTICSGLVVKPTYLTLQVHPGAVHLGLLLFGLVLFDALQETVSALWVLHVLNAHVDPLGQDPAPVTAETKDWKSKTWQEALRCFNVCVCLGCLLNTAQSPTGVGPGCLRMKYSPPREWPLRTRTIRVAKW